jgi:hypothetical protein
MEGKSGRKKWREKIAGNIAASKIHFLINTTFTSSLLRPPVANKKHVTCVMLFIAYGPGNIPRVGGPGGLQRGHNTNDDI